MPVAWIRCDDLDLAAAFSTLGVPWRPVRKHDLQEDKQTRIVFLGEQSAINPNIKTGPLMKMIKSGELQKADPEHPLLYALQGVKNYHKMMLGIDGSPTVMVMKRKGSNRCAFLYDTASEKTLNTSYRLLNS